MQLHVIMIEIFIKMSNNCFLYNCFQLKILIEEKENKSIYEFNFYF